MNQVAFEIAIIFLLIVGLLAVAIAASLLRPAHRAAPARAPRLERLDDSITRLAEDSIV